MAPWTCCRFVADARHLLVVVFNPQRTGHDIIDRRTVPRFDSVQTCQAVCLIFSNC